MKLFALPGTCNNILSELPSERNIIAALHFVPHHSPIAVATPQTLINGFKHVNGDSCRLLFFASIFYRAADKTRESKLSDSIAFTCHATLLCPLSFFAHFNHGTSLRCTYCSPHTQSWNTISMRTNTKNVWLEYFSVIDKNIQFVQSTYAIKHFQTKQIFVTNFYPLRFGQMLLATRGIFSRLFVEIYFHGTDGKRRLHDYVASRKK